MYSRIREAIKVVRDYVNAGDANRPTSNYFASTSLKLIESHLLTAESEPCEDAAPAIDPISGMHFFMMIKHPEKGWVPTYGGPYDSYTLCERDDEGIETDVVGFTRERYDHDEGEWVEGGEILDCALVTLHKASEISDKRTDELRKQVETLRNALVELRTSYNVNCDCGECKRKRNLSDEALTATEPKP